MLAVRKDRKNGLAELDSEEYCSEQGYERHYGSAAQRAAPAKAVKGRQKAGDNKPAPIAPPRSTAASIGARASGRPPKRQAAKDAEKSWGEKLDEQLERALRGLGPLSDDDSGEDDEDSHRRNRNRRLSPPPAARKVVHSKPAAQAKAIKAAAPSAAGGRGQQIRTDTMVAPKNSQKFAAAMGQTRSIFDSIWGDMGKSDDFWAATRREKPGPGSSSTNPFDMTGWRGHEPLEDEEVEAGTGMGGLVSGGWGRASKKSVATAAKGSTDYSLFERALSRDTIETPSCPAGTAKRQAPQGLPAPHGQLALSQGLQPQDTANQPTVTSQQKLSECQGSGTATTTPDSVLLVAQLGSQTATVPPFDPSELLRTETLQQNSGPVTQTSNHVPAAAHASAPNQQAGPVNRIPSPAPYLAVSKALPCSAPSMSPSLAGHKTPEQPSSRQASVSAPAPAYLPSRSSVSVPPSTDGGDVQMAGSEQDVSWHALCVPETLGERLAETVACTEQGRGALLLGKDRIQVIQGEADGKHQWSNVRCAEVGRAIGDALRAAREVMSEAKGLPSARLQCLQSLEKHVSGLESRAETLKELLDSKHRRAELLAATAYPNQVRGF